MSAMPYPVPRDERGEYPALVGVIPVTTGQRIAGRLLDAVLGGLVYVVAVFPFIAGLLTGSGEAALGGATTGLVMLLAYSVGYLIVFFVKGATLGQFVLGQQHLAVGTGQPAGGGAFVKYVLEALVAQFTFGLGYVASLLTIHPPLNRNWLDRVAGTILVDARAMRAAAAGQSGQGGAAWPASPPQGQGWAGAAAYPAWPAAPPAPTGAIRPPLDVVHPPADALPPPAQAAPQAVPVTPEAPGRTPSAPPVAPALLPLPPNSNETIIANVLGPVARQSEAVSILLDNGVRLPVDGLIVLGRDPGTRPGLEAARLVPVPDEDRSISKSHLVIGPTPDGIWIMDLESTNGTRVRDGHGTRRLSAGERSDVPLGATVEYGMRTLDVVSE